jgi:opacity protein-like surface antigen
MKKFALIAVAVVAAATVASAQMDNSKRPSPAASAECKFSDGKTIKVDYSSPRAKGRKIFGTEDDKALVPYGKIWRTGANEATKFVTDTNVTIGGKSLPAGSYTIFTIPNADKWTLIVNKKTAEWGIPYKYEADELGRFDMHVSKTSAPVENFSIAFEQGGGKCTMRLEWENTRASIDITK